MAKLAVHGFYGEGNLGDEAILEALLREVRRFPRANAVVFSKFPDRVAAEHGVPSVSEADRNRRLRRAWELATSRLVVLGGGGLLKDYGPDSANVRRWLRILRLAQRMRRPTAVWAVGVDDIRYPESAEMIRETLSRADSVSVRDGESAELLRSLGVAREAAVAADPALLLVRPRPAPPSLSPPRILVSVRRWFRTGPRAARPEREEAARAELAAALDLVAARRGAAFDFVPLRTVAYDDDRAVARDVAGRMLRRERATVFESVPPLDSLGGLFAPYAAAVGMRLHSLILAAGSGVPVVGLEYAPKVGAFLRGIGQGECSLPLETVTREQIAAGIEEALDHREERARILRERTGGQRERAREGIAALARLAGLEATAAAGGR